MRLSEIGTCLPRNLCCDKGNPQVVQRFWEIGRNLQCLLEHRDGLIYVFFQDECTAKVIVCQPIERVDGDGLLIKFDGLVEVFCEELSWGSRPAQRDDTRPRHRVDGQGEFPGEGQLIFLPLAIILQGELVMAGRQVKIDLAAGKNLPELLKRADRPCVISRVIEPEPYLEQVYR